VSCFDRSVYAEPLTCVVVEDLEALVKPELNEQRAGAINGGCVFEEKRRGAEGSHPRRLERRRDVKDIVSERL